MSAVAGVAVTVDGIPWPVQGAQVAVIEADRVLLQFRPWPPGWELPGGHCEASEDPAMSAAREAEEETGLRVRIERLVGVYTWGGLRSAGDVLYLGSNVGGRRRRSLEAWSSRWFAREQLPRTVFPWMRQRILDAFACTDGAAPIHRLQPVTLYHVGLFATAWLRAPVDRIQRRGRGAASR